MADQQTEIAMRRAYDEARRQAIRPLQGGLLQRLGRGRFSRLVRGAALTAMLGTGARGMVPPEQQARDRLPVSPDALVQTLPSQAPSAEDQGFTETEADEMPETLSPDEQIQMRRELSQQVRRDQTLQTSVQAQSQVQEDQQAGRSAGSVFSRLRSTIRNLRQQETQAEESVETEAASAAAEQAVRAGYTWAHEALEELCLSFADLGIISGPSAIALYLARLTAPLYNRLFMIQVKGVRVPAVPGYLMGELIVRTGKILIVALITATVWGMIIIVIYAVFHPLEALKMFGSTFMDALELLT